MNLPQNARTDPAGALSGTPPAAPVPRRSGHGRSALLIALIAVAAGSAITLAMRQTSTTFDEIILVAGGTRGYATGEWSIAPEHPPFTQYLYGFLPHLTKPALPVEPLEGIERYTYARDFFFSSGNDPEQLAFLGRLPGVVCALLLIILVFRVTAARFGEPAGLLSAAMVAFLPDVLAHSGVAYNDVPVTLAIFGAAWLADAAMRTPTLARGAAFGLAAGLALGTKNSAVALLPITILLAGAEATRRYRDPAWRRGIMLAAAGAIVATYAALVLVYRGDFTLAEYRYSLNFVFGQVTEESSPSYLLGRTTVGGWWYYFPLAFLFKTSAAFHVLLLLTVLYYARRLRQPEPVRRLLSSPLRVPLIVLLVFALLLLRAKLNIGFRYAMPALPMLAVLCATGVVAVWQAYGPRARALIAAAVAWLIIHPLSYYPNFLAYISEYGPGRDRNYAVLVDSSMDWGQGLLQLRDFMRENAIPSVYLSYYGSALPSGYGIQHVPLVSFLALPGPGSGTQPIPRFIVISATNLAGGTYFAGIDPYRKFREVEPAFIVGNTMYGFPLSDSLPGGAQ